MSKKLTIKKLIIILVIINILYILLFNGFLICETWLVRQNGSFYCLSQSLDDYILAKVNNPIFPIEISHEFVNSPDYVNNLMEKAINLSLIYRILELVQVIIIIVLIVDYKTSNN